MNDRTLYRESVILKNADNPIMTSTQWSPGQLLAVSVYWPIDQPVAPEGSFLPSGVPPRAHNRI